MEAAHAGGAVRRAGDDGHEGVIGAVLIACHVVLAVRCPVHQEALRIVACGLQVHARQGVFPLAKSRPQLPGGDTLGHHRDTQGLLPLSAQLLCHGAVGALLHIEVLQLSQGGATVIASLAQGLPRLLAALLILFRVVVQQGAAHCTEVALLVFRDTVGHQALRRFCCDARGLRQGFLR